jgi:protein tyrosine phosphatase (PTP) superfamily phosphohydrolase (DUF442 family)
MTPLQRAVREIEVRVEKLQRPVFATCRTDYQRSRVIEAYADLARLQIDAVSQQHGMKPMLWRVR